MPVKSAAAAPPGGFTGAGGAAFSSARGDWETPAWLFLALDSGFHFTLDAASSNLMRPRTSLISAWPRM